jgi:hypothetical protein
MDRAMLAVVSIPQVMSASVEIFSIDGNDLEPSMVIILE